MRAKIRILLIVGLVIFGCLAMNAATSKDHNPKAEKMEARADKTFIRGDFPKALKMYERAGEVLQDGEQKYRLELKMARLYILLQMPEEAANYYHAVQLACDTLLSVNDVCFYIDALRQRDQIQRAEIVARHYAFKSTYARNQRYVNALNALSNQHHYYGVGEPEYSVQMVGKHTDLPEYWLGKYNGKLFYAASHSRMQDPLKIFYHQTQYFQLNEGGLPEQFRTIPRELQSGPVVFSKDNDLMIATGIDYRSSSRIVDITSNNGLFITQIYYSRIDHKNNRWSSFKPLFEYQQGYNYAHPMMFNDDRSLVFSSDRPGGYGGMDLYVSHWDEQQGQWGEPINLGPIVNTQGDEVYPHVMEDGLYFSSNGLEGYGGYDIYRVNYGPDGVVPGSISHYPYPINTVYNDFGIYFDHDYPGTGYFVSDRNENKTKDNIYMFNSRALDLTNVGVSQEYSAMTGNLNDIMGMNSNTSGTTMRELEVSPMYRTVAEGDVLLSIYFDFNKSTLTRESRALLDDLLKDYAYGYVSELLVAGYADDFGGAQYNRKLSAQRAEAVAGYMEAHERCPALYVEGRGQISLSPEEMQEALSQIQFDGQYNAEMQGARSLTMDDRIMMRSRLRRVDIIVAK